MIFPATFLPASQIIKSSLKKDGGNRDHHRLPPREV
jgi:hypothetical protein